MKLGLSDLLVLLIMGGIALFLFRGNTAPKRASPPPIRVRRPTAAEIEEERIKNSRRSRLRFLGGAFLVIGLITLAGTLKMFNILFLGYAGAALVMLAGIVVLYLSARR